MSVRAFAAHLGVAVASVTNWERRGESIRMRDETLEILDRDLSCVSEDVRARFDATLAAIPTPAGLALSRDVAHRPEAEAATPSGSGSLVDRRQVLLSGLAAVAVASGLIGPRPLHRRVGQGDVDRLSALTALYRSVDYELGGGALVRDVGALAESASSLLDLSYADALVPRLMSAVAAARQLAGWTAFDAGLHSDAQRHFLAAERTAVAADDRLLVARVRYSLARQYQHLVHNRDALDTLRLAREQLGSASTPAVTAMLLGAEAASLAAMGDQLAALRSLGRASDAFGQVEEDREPDWMRFYGEGELLAQYGRVYRDFARSDSRTGAEAVRWVMDAIAAFGPQDVRSSVLNEVGLCSALLLTGETDQAITVGHRVIGQARTLSSRRILDRINNLRRDLGSHRSVPAVAEFARSLASVGAGKP